jgi:hypothetical protein
VSRVLLSLTGRAETHLAELSTAHLAGLARLKPMLESVLKDRD